MYMYESYIENKDYIKTDWLFSLDLEVECCSVKAGLIDEVL